MTSGNTYVDRRVCQRCHNVVETDHCTFCGYHIIRKCPRCSADVEEGKVKFCPKCGLKLGGVRALTRRYSGWYCLFIAVLYVMLTIYVIITAGSYDDYEIPTVLFALRMIMIMLGVVALPPILWSWHSKNRRNK